MIIRPVATALLAAQLTLCVACGQAKETHATVQPRQQLTQTEARRIHHAYQQAYLRALHAGGRGMEHAEAGLALKLTRTQFRLAAKTNDPISPPPPISEARYTIPRPQPGRARWFLATITYTGATARTHLIFEETTAGWRVVAASRTDRQVPQPHLDAQGQATALDAGTRTGLIADPLQVAHAHGWSVASAHRAKQARTLLAPGEHTTQAARAVLADRAVLRGQWWFRHAARVLPPIYALRTADGGALAWYGLHDRQRFLPATASPAPIRFAKTELARRAYYARRVSIDRAGWFLAAIPPAGSRAKADIIGAWSLTTAVDGA
ncbi:hypothetical protein [Spongiactinospora sp. 9N601]|uniref:hypothetical protein n=1 Tax=Spongiactinospora sp. 9N601 TaxID=3375149 RepID=UPI0037AC947F